MRNVQFIDEKSFTVAPRTDTYRASFLSTEPTLVKQWKEKYSEAESKLYGIYNSEHPKYYNSEHPKYEYAYDRLTNSISIKPVQIWGTDRDESAPDSGFAVSRQQLDDILNDGVSMGVVQHD